LTGTASSLSIGGNAATATSATSATTATNLAGGANGSVPYQTGSGATTFLVAGTNGYVMTLAGGVPTWAASSSGITITDNTSSNSTYYLTLTTATSGTITGETTSSTKLNFIPSTGTLNTSAHGLNGSTSGTVTLNSVAIAGTNTATFPAATGTVMVSGNMPSFSASPSGQTIATGVSAQIVYGTPDWNLNSNFASNKFTPTVAGYYQVNVSQYTGDNPIGSNVTIRKNGSEWSRGTASTTANTNNFVGSALIYCNGSTDYIDAAFYNGAVTTITLGSLSLSKFSACLVRTA